MTDTSYQHITLSALCSTNHPGESKCVFITATVTLLLVAAVHAVGIRVAAPADRDAVAVFALELIIVTLHITAVLKTENHSIFILIFTSSRSL